MKKDYGDDLAIVFKHYPLGFHQQALPSAKATMAALQQDKFWEYHDKVFESQKDLADEKYPEWAKELGLDVEKFKADMNDPKIAEKINQDMAEGNRAGVGGTPTLYINGRKFQPAGGYNAASFKAVIDSEILGK